MIRNPILELHYRMKSLVKQGLAQVIVSHSLKWPSSMFATSNFHGMIALHQLSTLDRFSVPI
jgi:hypothetical protein